jgi:plastocyanin
MNPKRYLLLILFVAVFSLALAACGGGGGDSGPPPLNVTIRGQDIKFDVTEIKAKVGQQINVTYINEGTLEHNFIIEGVVPEVKLQSGERTTFAFTPTAAGTLEYHCTVPGHLEAGMTGKVIVEP